MSVNVLKCNVCKEKFNKDDLIYYTTARAQKGFWYCPKCYKEKLNREYFFETVCSIFGIKAPGPRIWRDRQRLLRKGYTDEIIVDCLDYIYSVKRYKKLSESLVLVKEDMINEMLKWKKSKEYEAQSIISALKNNNQNIQTQLKLIKENNNDNKEFLNVDDFLKDD